MCKRREAFSLAVLIGRGLVLIFHLVSLILLLHLLPLFGFQGVSSYFQAPLAQLVEHLTLNQGAQGSSP